MQHRKFCGLLLKSGDTEKGKKVLPFFCFLKLSQVTCLQLFVEANSVLKFTKVEEISSHALLGQEPEYAEANTNAGNKYAH